jgi:hypothetical protein
MPQVYVFQPGDKCTIRTKGRVQVYFADHALAVAATIDIAESTGKTGRNAKVLVHAERHAFRKIVDLCEGTSIRTVLVALKTIDPAEPIGCLKPSFS